jgi:hypothetical protein
MSFEIKRGLDVRSIFLAIHAEACLFISQFVAMIQRRSATQTQWRDIAYAVESQFPGRNEKPRKTWYLARFVEYKEGIFVSFIGGGGGDRTRVRKPSTDSSTYLALPFDLTQPTRTRTLRMDELPWI